MFMQRFRTVNGSVKCYICVLILKFQPFEIVELFLAEGPDQKGMGRVC